MRVTIKTAANLLSLFWPEFVEHNGLVLLAGSEHNARRNAAAVKTATELEAFVSHTHVLDELRHGAKVHDVMPDDDTSLYDEHHPDFIAACKIGRAMGAMWAAKLRYDFPHYRFRVYWTKLDNPIVRFHRVRPDEPPWLSDDDAHEGIVGGTLSVWDTINLPAPAA